MADLIDLDALGPAGPYRARNRETIPDVTGRPVAELSLVPSLFVRRGMAALHRADTLPADRRAAALAHAGQIFATGVIDGMSRDEYEHTVTRVCGLPISVVRAATDAVALAAQEAYTSADAARPAAAVDDWHDPLTRQGRALWTRRGNVFAVHAAGNHPAVHSLWLEALALGYRVAVRPSRREPFTPHRLILALREAGFPDDSVLLLPTDHRVADEIIDGAELAMAYGGDDVVARYGRDPRVLTQGPGRTKILLDDPDWRSHLDVVVDSVSHEGGVACVNTTAVFVAGDPAPVAAALAERLATIPTLPPEDEKAVLPVRGAAAAHAVERYLLDHAGDARMPLGGDGVADELGDGSAALRPAVLQLDRPDAPQAGIELPFPCVWVAPWSREDGVGPVRGSLVLTAITADDALLDELVAEPTISNVYIGDHPTYWIRPGIPHDRYLGEFLMRTKAMIRA
ncbi:aldehyde dehydrogenase family protein [Frankia sp. Mgl5]|uniref:aldehyde dehydrogenase family protein n=1 Tax=Frankia sp. Mgl5 TaxID=2933793 RepID=UPI0020107C6A|nr:aldehyde dehydrogenase family protein [Frankia sp. Mgl5]MCK9931023.1 aldehyde dehydrogenase family protein [Frankia sp. Mgl5]